MGVDRPRGGVALVGRSLRRRLGYDGEPVEIYTPVAPSDVLARLNQATSGPGADPAVWTEHADLLVESPYADWCDPQVLVQIVPWRTGARVVGTLRYPLRWHLVNLLVVALATVVVFSPEGGGTWSVLLPGVVVLLSGLLQRRGYRRMRQWFTETVAATG